MGDQVPPGPARQHLVVPRAVAERGDVVEQACRAERDPAQRVRAGAGHRAAGSVGDAATTRFVQAPMPSTAVTTLWPGVRYRCGSRA